MLLICSNIIVLNGRQSTFGSVGKNRSEKLQTVQSYYLNRTIVKKVIKKLRLLEIM